VLVSHKTRAALEGTDQQGDPAGLQPLPASQQTLWVPLGQQQQQHALPFYAPQQLQQQQQGQPEQQLWAPEQQYQLEYGTQVPQQFDLLEQQPQYGTQVPQFDQVPQSDPQYRQMGMVPQQQQDEPQQYGQQHSQEQHGLQVTAPLQLEQQYMQPELLPQGLLPMVQDYGQAVGQGHGQGPQQDDAQPAVIGQYRQQLGPQAAPDLNNSDPFLSAQQQQQQQQQSYRDQLPRPQFQQPSPEVTKGAGAGPGYMSTPDAAGARFCCVVASLVWQSTTFIIPAPTRTHALPPACGATLPRGGRLE